MADDHHVVRRGLQALLEKEADFSVIGEAGDGLEAIELTEQLQPDVLVVDLMMPRLNGLEVIRQVGRRSPGTRIVVLSMYADEAYVLEALGAGANAYVLKESMAEELLQAIRQVAAGRHYLSSPLSEHAIEAYREKAEAAFGDGSERLTNRERQVLQLTAEGLSCAEIAVRLFISRRTVETHRTHVMKKLGLRSQADLIRYALRRGILPMEGPVTGHGRA